MTCWTARRAGRYLRLVIAAAEGAEPASHPSLVRLVWKEESQEEDTSEQEARGLSTGSRATEHGSHDERNLSLVEALGRLGWVPPL